MKRILTSGCLYGWTCRYDGNNRPLSDLRYLQWKADGVLVPVCPEVCGGLPTPRPPAQRQPDGSVRTEAGDDVTAAYEAGAAEALRLAIEKEAVLCILKEGSPSCGCRCIYDGTFSGNKIPGEGTAAQLLRESGFPVFNENEMAEAVVFWQKTQDSVGKP